MDTSDERRDGVRLDREQPEVHRALLGVASQARKAAREAGFDRRLVELVNIRCSQLNGCAACLDTHVRQAVKAGETTRRLGVLSAWRETELFSDQERAALDLAEAWAQLPPRDLAAVEARASDHLDAAQRAAVLGVVAAICAFNQITIAGARAVRPEGDEAGRGSEGGGGGAGAAGADGADGADGANGANGGADR